MTSLRAVLLVVSLLLIGACAGEEQDLVIGIALTEDYHYAVQMAAEEINSNGGIGGARLSLVGLDWRDLDCFEPRDAIRWAERFAEIDNLVAVIGHSDSATTLASAPFYNRRRIPQVVTIATNPAITDIGPWTYRLCLSDDIQGKGLADYAVTSWHKKRFAIFYVDDDYGRQLASIFQEDVRQLGGEIISSVPTHNVLGEVDWGLIERCFEHLEETGFTGDGDCLVLLYRQISAIEVLGALASRPGITRSLLGADATAMPAVAATATRLSFDLRASMFFTVSPDNPKSELFTAQFEQRWERRPSYASALAYDAIYLVWQAADIGGATREGVQQGLLQLVDERHPITGAAGTYVLGPDHDSQRAFHIGVVESGVFVPVEMIAFRALRARAK